MLVAASLTPGCAIDSRTLSAGSGSRTGVDGEGGSGDEPGNGTGGTSTTPVELPRCVYDGSVDAECETLVENAGFVSDTAGWSAEDGSYGNWDSMNASGSMGSGSISLLNVLSGTAQGGVAPGAARQCLPASPNTTYDFAGDIFIPEGQGAGPKDEMYEALAGLSMFFFAEEDCAGESKGNADSKMITETGVWVHVTGAGTAPELTKSVLVRLNTLKPIRQFAFKASFDNVFVRAR